MSCLRIEWELVEFHEFHEGSVDPPLLTHGCEAVRVEDQRVPERLLRLPDRVGDEQLRSPEFLPIYRLLLLFKPFQTNSNKQKPDMRQVVEGLTILRYPRELENKGLITQKT